MAVALPRGESVPRDLWILAGASGLFVLGAASTKDYADMEGDRAGGCITLPLRFGVEKSVNIVAPFLVVPWLLVAVATALGFLAGNHFVLFWGGIVLGTVGLRAVRLLVRDPQALTSKSTHPSWVLMYLLMVFSQLVAALAYALPPALGAGFAP
jgi:4-hydroxybenzoate polyprenyltransferase